MRRARRFVLRFGRTLCGWWALALYLVMALGLPIPALGGKDLSKPFPCMHSQCGCRTADQCWRSCCCSTLLERLAWARDHGVTPPPVAIAQARAQKIDIAKIAGKQARGKSTNCCSKGGGHCQASKQKSCCDKAHGAEQPTADDSVVMIQSLRCQGQSINLLSTTPALPPVTVVWSFQASPRPCSELHAPCLLPLVSPPPVPPPQYAAV